MKLIMALVFFPFFAFSAKASINLIDEVDASYKNVSKQLVEYDEKSIVRKVQSSENLDEISLEEWIIYSKTFNQNLDDETSIIKNNNVKFRLLDNFTQLFSFYLNECREGIDEGFKKYLIKSWWVAALVSKEDSESLQKAYMYGKPNLIEKDDRAYSILKNIEHFIFI